MQGYDIYKDIAKRTGGDIYIGVVGPVRTGKSTFIKQFMDTLVIPNISDGYDKERALDEMPQSGSGKMIMTTEPKFIPDSAIEIKVADSASLKVRMIDCVGYIVPEAMGHIGEDGPRMVTTPWFDSPVEFEKAAEMGTRKVISDHSTIGIVVTTDGTIGDISRESYVEAEKRVINELKELKKPFVIVLNSADTQRSESIELAYQLEDTYDVPVALVNCLDMNGDDIRGVIEMVLLEFPVREICVTMPQWMSMLNDDHPLHKSINDSVLNAAYSVRRAGDIRAAADALADGETIVDSTVVSVDLGRGCAEIELKFDEALYYKVLSELCGIDIPDERSLLEQLCALSAIKCKYDKVEKALNDANATGYGIVTPDVEDLRLEEPEIIRQSSGYGVRLRAAAPSIHMIKADIETELNPIVGSEQQSEELVKHLMSSFEQDPHSIWDSNIFGTSLHKLVNEGLNTKLANMPDDARKKIGQTLERIINEGSGGLICIIL
jgi:stage IV sporulation protein A